MEEENIERGVGGGGAEENGRNKKKKLKLRSEELVS